MQEQVTVNVRRVGDDWYGSSKQVPGLHMGGKTPDSLVASLPKGVQFLYKANRGLDVNVQVMDGQTKEVGPEVRLLVTA